MGTEIKPSVLRGFAVPIPAVTVDAWEDTNSPTTTATEAGRIAGAAIVNPDSSDFQDPALRLLTSGTPTNDDSVYVDTHRAGLPGRDEARFLYRDGQTTSDPYKGQEAFGLLSGWEVVRNAAHPSGNRPHIIRTAGGYLLGIYEKGATTARTVVYDPRDGSTEHADVAMDSGATGVAVATAPHSSATDGERIYLYAGSASLTDPNVEVWFTDDGPEGTFLRANPSALDSFPASTASPRIILGIRAAIAPNGQTLLLIWYDNGSAEDIAQYAATTPAGPFRVVSSSYTADLGSGANTRPDCIALPGGGFVVTYHIQGSKYESARLSDAEQAPGEFEITSRSIAPTAANTPDQSMWIGEDGRLWWLYAYSPGAGANRGLRLSYSDDQGEQWTDTDTEIFQSTPGNTPSDSLTAFSAVDIGGRVAVLTEYTGAAAVALAWFGGQTDMTGPYDDRGYRSQFAAVWGDERSAATADRAGGAYLPIDTPGNVSWTASGAGSFAVTTGLCVATCTAGQTAVATRTVSDQSNLDDDANATLFAEVQLLVASGTEEGSGLQVVLSDKEGASAATYAYAVSVRVGLDGSGDHEIELWDDTAGTQVGATVATGSAALVSVRVALNEDGDVLTWWRVGTDHESEWTAGPSSTGLTDDVASNPGTSIAFGRIWGTGAQTATFYMVGYCLWGYRFSPMNGDTLGSSWSNPTDVHGIPYSPTWRYLTDGWRIRAEGGETMGVVTALDSYSSEGWILNPGHTYSRDHMIPGAYPSPAVTTRTTGTGSDAIWSWSLGADTLAMSTTLALPVFRANVRYVKLQYWTGSALQDIGILDLAEGLTSLPYTKDGDCLIIDTGGSGNSATVIQPGELRGATVKEGSNYAKIADNSGGVWRDDGATVRPILRLEDASGISASGTIDIWRRSGVLVVHGFTASTTHLAVRISAQSNADGYFEIGLGVPHEVFIFGQQYGKGRSLTTEVPAEIEYSEGGVPRSVQSGLGRRVLTFGWGEGVDTGPLFAASPDPAYVTGIDSGRGLAFPAATAHDLEWHIRRIGGAATPVVVLPRIPRGAGSHSLTESDAFVYGHIENTIDRQPFEGSELESTCGEVARVEVLRVREIPGCWEV